jgi:hypothetical protein
MANRLISEFLKNRDRFIYPIKKNRSVTVLLLRDYLDFFSTFLASFAVLVGTDILTPFSCFGRQPHPQGFFCSAIVSPPFWLSNFAIT